MDKYEFNIKVEQIRKLVGKGDYETAMKITDTIDWKKVRNANLLSMVAQVYEKNEEYQEAKDILLTAFERAPIGKRLLYKLTELALKEGNTEEAEAYYREFCDLAGDDPRQHLLRFLILKEKGAPMEQLIHSLEGYTAEELDEKWLYELAELYHEAGNDAMCVSTCDKIMLMFGLGKYVDKAMELKIQYAPLTKYQMDLVENRDKYEAKLRAVEQSIPEEPVISEEPEVMPEIPNAPEPVEEITEEPEPEPIYVEAEPEPEAIVAAARQTEVEEHLAKEMSKITVDEVPEEDDMGKTRVLGDIRRAQILNQETMILPDLKRAPKEEPAVEDPSDDEPVANHLMIEARTPERGMELALRTLKQIQIETGVKNPVIKITGSKLNKRGILANLEKLSGKDLMIEEAGDLNEELLGELDTLMSRDESGMRIILIDNPKQMEMLHAGNPGLASRFECIGNGNDSAEERVTQEEEEPEVAAQPAEEVKVDNRPVRRVEPIRDSAMRSPEPRGFEPEPEQEDTEADIDEDEMDIDEFAQFACKYASEIDCSITGKSMLALYERIEIMEEEGIPLTRSSAEELIEEAADRAERPSLGKLITGVFSSKYDKDGLLILKEEHFI